MAVFAKDGIEVLILLRSKPGVLDPTETTYEIEIDGKTEAQKRNRDFRNQETEVTWENNVIKTRDKGVLCNHVPWDDANANLRSFIFYSREQRGKDNCNRRDQAPTFRRQIQKNSCESWKISS